MPIKIYHNPRCSKSRQALAILNDKGAEPEVVNYIENPISKDELKSVIAKLGIKPEELLRKKEADYKELGLNEQGVSADKIISAMISHPKLMERPIVVSGNKAVVARPPELAADFC